MGTDGTIQNATNTTASSAITATSLHSLLLFLLLIPLYTFLYQAHFDIDSPSYSPARL